MNIESSEPKLIVGPFQLVLHSDSIRMVNLERWALPGGSYASLQELKALCTDNGWPNPKRITL